MRRDHLRDAASVLTAHRSFFGPERPSGTLCSMSEAAPQRDVRAFSCGWPLSKKLVDQYGVTLTIRSLQASDAATASLIALDSFERYIAESWSADAYDEYRCRVSTAGLPESIDTCTYSTAHSTTTARLVFCSCLAPT